MTTLECTSTDILDPTVHLSAADIENLGAELDAIRAEVISAVEVNANTPSGKAVRIELQSADFHGLAYFSGLMVKVPSNGSVVDVVLEKKESPKAPGTFVTLIKSIEVVG